MSSILVTGAAGFIGAKVTELLLAEGHSVVGVDELNHSSDPRLKRWRLDHLCRHPAFVFHRIDICDSRGMLEVFRGAAEASGFGRFDAVINLAARVGVRQSVGDPYVYFETNVTGTLNLLELCRHYGVPKFVLASTSSLYGTRNHRPYSEDADTDRPLSPYAASKKAAEGLCYSYHELHGIDVAVLRYFTVYGPAGRPDMAPFRFVQWILEGRPLTLYGDGTQERDFTYVEDIARGTIAALKSVGYEVINLGSDRPVRLTEFIRLVERCTGAAAQIRHEPRHPADVLATWACIDKAKRILGWQPETDLEAGVERLVEWYRENRDWAKDVATF